MIIPSKNYSDAELFLTRIIISYRHNHVNLARALATQTSRFFVNHEIHENVLSCLLRLWRDDRSLVVSR